MPATSKDKLSGSTDGRGIKVVATASPGTTIHTAVAGTGVANYDEVWIWAYNSHTASLLLTLQFGGTTTPDDDIKVTLATQAGLILVVPGLILQNTDVLKAYAASANLVVLFGFVNTIRA